MAETSLLRSEAGVRAWVSEIIARCYAARSSLNAWQYAEQIVYLDGQAAAEPGFYKSSLTPFTRRFQELGCAPDIDPLTGYFVDQVTVMKSSRSGFTEAALNVIRWMPVHQPGPVLYCIDSKTEVKAISKTRLRPTLERIIAENPDLAPKDIDDLGTYELYLANMLIRLAGSFSEGVFANKFLLKAFLDECEVMAQSLGDSNPIELARSRGTTVAKFQLFLLSKPKRPKTAFHKEYLDGTQEKWFVPCPHCGHMQELVWNRVRYDHCKELNGEYDKNRVLVETYYQCAGEKGCRIAEAEKNGMVAKGEWRITNPNFVPGKVSQHISDLYSPFEKVSWGNLALIYITSQSSIAKIRHFHNNYLGLPFEEHKLTLKVEDLLKLRSGVIDQATGIRQGPPYNFGQLPWKPAMIVCTSDMQDDRVKWGTWALKPSNNAAMIEAALIDYGASLGLADLLDLMKKGYYLAGDPKPYFPFVGLIDSGWATFEVYDFCLENEGVWYPSKGVSGVTSGQLVQMKTRDWRGSEILRYDYEDHGIKIEFYEGKIKKVREPRIWFPTNLNDHPQLMDELISERLISREDANGYTKLVWEKTSGVPNDWGDMSKMILVMIAVLGEQVVQLSEEMEAEAKKAKKK